MNEFTPSDTDNTFYILGGTFSDISFEEIIERAREKWGEDIDLGKLKINADYIQTRIGYDLYDPSDYSNYLVIEYRG